MKTNKILAVALSAGLVLGGASYAHAGQSGGSSGTTQVAPDAKAKAEKELTELKKQAVAIVESNFDAGNIDETSKKDYINRVNTSESKEEINGILNLVYQEYKNKQNPPKPEEKEEEESNIFDNQDEENNLMGYNSENSAEEAAKDAMEAEKGKYKKYEINQVGKKYFYELIPFENNNEDGFPTKEEAIEAAKKALKSEELNKDGINKSYTITQGANGRYFYQLSLEESDQDSKEEKPGKSIPWTDLTPAQPTVPTPGYPTPAPGGDNEIVLPEEKPADKPEEKPADNKGTEIEKENPKQGEEKEEKAKDKEKAKPAKQKGNNPKTGLVGLAPIYSTLAISMAGIVAARKKND